MRKNAENLDYESTETDYLIEKIKEALAKDAGFLRKQKLRNTDNNVIAADAVYFYHTSEYLQAALIDAYNRGSFHKNGATEKALQEIRNLGRADDKTFKKELNKALKAMSQSNWFESITNVLNPFGSIWGKIILSAKKPRGCEGFVTLLPLAITAFEPIFKSFFEGSPLKQSIGESLYDTIYCYYQYVFGRTRQNKLFLYSFRRGISTTNTIY
jgi:hypothetical protein